MNEIVRVGDDVVELGQWYWIVDDDGKEHIACVTEFGSNFTKFNFVVSSGGRYRRVHHDEWHKEVKRREVNPDAYIQQKVTAHQTTVHMLLGEIKQLTAHLGIVPEREQLGASEQTNALVIAHSTKNIEEHKAALIKAKEETLPELFKKVKVEHELMAMWMKAQLIPMESQVDLLKRTTEPIEDRIFAVELYAGLVETLAKIQDGKPAPIDEKLHLFQRRHYMDEECLVDYQAGGMEFKNMEAFDKWLLKKPNRERIFPFPRCAIAFQIRRHEKERHADDLAGFIKFMDDRETDKLTFLYIRNGEQFFRLNTAIQFGEELFPDAQNSLHNAGKLYIKDYGDRVATQREVDAEELEYQERVTEYKQELAVWQKLSKAERKKKITPHKPHKWHHFSPLTPDSVYYDDGMRTIAKEVKQHNRIVLVLQGLFDRSMAFHPHPPVKLWFEEDFNKVIALHYDNSRGLSTGAKPDFETYHAEINSMLKPGCFTVGQRLCWLEGNEDKYNMYDSYHSRRLRHGERRLEGDPGPRVVHEVIKMSLDRKTCTFRWERERLGWNKRIPNPDKPGWLMRDESPLGVRFKAPTNRLFNVSAYTPGDYKQFYADPRTRADYLQWAPFLLAAEDFHAHKETK